MLEIIYKLIPKCCAHIAFLVLVSLLSRQAWWHRFVIPPTQRMSQENHKSQPWESLEVLSQKEIESVA